MRQFDPESAPNAPSLVASRTPERYGFQRIALACVGVLGTGALLALAGCPANLANPEDYNHENGSMSGGSMSGGSMGGGPIGGNGSGGGSQVVDVPVPTCMTDILTSSCALQGCHLGAVAGNLDLTPAGVGKRLVNVTAGHVNAFPDMACVAGQKLIDSANPQASWLVQKLTTDGTKCGLGMPPFSPLDATQVACFSMYADAVSAAAKGSP